MSAPGRSLRPILRDLYRPDPRIRWAAVRALGELAAAREPAGARELVRRFTWALSDESGATAWGAPEAVGEILARVPVLRADFAGLFVGWLSDEEVILGNAVLDAGALWAIGRVGPGAPLDSATLLPVVRRFLAHPVPDVRGAAAFAAGRQGLGELAEPLGRLRGDPAPAILLLDGEIVARPVGELARGALAGFYRSDR